MIVINDNKNYKEKQFIAGHELIHIKKHPVNDLGYKCFENIPYLYNGKDSIFKTTQSYIISSIKFNNKEAASAKSEELTNSPTEKSIPKEYSNALTKAKIYSDTMYMSKAAIHDQLTSEYGEGFSEEAADYAIENLVTDYKANALQKAHTYQDTMAMSKNAIYDQLISEYGEQFTEEAQYAIDNLE